jgi:hypothetical protein
MGNLAFALRRVQSGDKVWFFHDFYGRQWVELRRAWFWPRTRIHLRADEILQVKSALDGRRRSRAQGAREAHQQP